MTAVAQRKRLLRLVELAGPAGVGKSTISRALLQRCPAVPGTIWGQPVLSLLGNGVQLAPTIAPFWRHSGSLLWNESRYMVRLQTLHRSVLQEQRFTAPIVIFDEGPIFALAWLHGFGHQSMRSEISDPWWGATLAQWARAVDVIVVLDAPDAVLAERIRARPEWHEVKHSPDPYISQWMARFRAALDWVLAGLVAQGGPVVLRISADQDHPEGIADRIVAALGGGSDDN